MALPTAAKPPSIDDDEPATPTAKPAAAEGNGHVKPASAAKPRVKAKKVKAAKVKKAKRNRPAPATI